MFFAFFSNFRELFAPEILGVKKRNVIPKNYLGFRRQIRNAIPIFFCQFMNML